MKLVVLGIAGLLGLAPDGVSGDPLRFEFEPGDAPPTFSPSATSDGWRAEVVEAPVHSGRGALTWTPAQPPSGRGAAWTLIDASAYQGEAVRVTAWLRSPQGAGPAGFQLRIDGADGRALAQVRAPYEPGATGEWLLVSTAVIMPSGANVIRLGLYATDAPLTVDDILLERISPDARSMSPEAETYLTEALDVLEAHHLNRATVNWPRMRQQAAWIAAGATVAADTYPAIRAVIGGLGETHSSFRPPVPANTGAPGSNLPPVAPDLPPPSGRLAAPGVGQLTAPGLWTIGLPESVSTDYRETLRTGIAELRAEGVCGWIVDLRDNIGGNMWPMLNGLSPLLDRGPFGAFGDADRDMGIWTRTDGEIVTAQTADDSATPGTEASAPVAVLIGGRTSSSGEMTAIAFRGRPGARFFGGATAGFTTANIPAALPDGALLSVTVSGVRDRTGELIRGGLRPDETTSPEAAPEAALRWLRAQGCPAA